MMQCICFAASLLIASGMHDCNVHVLMVVVGSVSVADCAVLRLRALAGGMAMCVCVLCVP